MTENITIKQGETYYFPPFEIDNDWTGGVPRGQIRDKYLYLEDSEVLAYFQFEDLTYDSVTDKTTVKPYINHQFTSSIPPHPKWKRGNILSEKNTYLLDIEIEKDGVVTKIDTHFVEIIPEVTDNNFVVDSLIIWDGKIDHIELTETNGLVNTYTAWGDADETVNLGTFDVTDGVGIESATYNESVNTLTVTLTNGTITETGSLKGVKGDTGDTPDAQSIKTLYESNLDTNAFTDSEKTQLGNLETNLANKADLVGGVIPNSQIPSIAITEFLGEVADEPEMLLLTGEKGDWAIRVDTGSMWILTGNTSSSLDNWLDVPTPPSGVISVNGYQGIVVLTYSDVGAASAAQGTKADTALQPKLKNVISVNSTVNLILNSVYYQFYTPTVASVDVICPVLTSEDNFEIEIFNKHETNALVVKDSASNILGTLSSESITEDRSCRLFWDGTDLHFLPLGGY